MPEEIVEMFTSGTAPQPPVPTYIAPNVEVSELSETEVHKGEVIIFLTSDWVLDPVSGDYYLQIYHNLDSINPLTIIRDINDSVMVNRVEIIDTCTLRVWVPFFPDCRFSGIVSIAKA